MAVDEEEKTIMMEGGGADGKLSLDGNEKAPRANLICLDDSMLDVSQKGLVIPLVGDEVTLGRGTDNTHPITFQKISRNHARLYPMAGKWVIEDLNSTNGVWVDETRTKEARLRPGNYVKIGAIPFQFQLERPDAVSAPVGVADDGDGEGTMIFGAEGGKAEDRMIKVDTEQRGKPVEKPVTPQESKPAPSVSGIAPETGTKGRKMGVMISLLLVFAIAGGVYMWLQPGDTGHQQVKAHQKSAKKFASELEETVGVPSDRLVSEQIEKIRNLTTLVEQDVKQYASNPSFQGLLAQLLLLDMERQLVLLVRSERAQDGETMILRALERVGRMSSRIHDPELGKEAIKTLKTVENIFDLAKHVMAIKRFRQDYPTPSQHAEKMPSKRKMNSIMKIRQAFVEAKKNPRTNIALTVGYPMLSNLVTEVDEDDLLSLDQWREIVNKLPQF